MTKAVLKRGDEAVDFRAAVADLTQLCLDIAILAPSRNEEVLEAHDRLCRDGLSEILVARVSPFGPRRPRPLA